MPGGTRRLLLPLALLFVAQLFVCPAVTLAEDVVWQRSGKAASKVTRRTGTILEYRGAGLRLRTLGGREVVIPTKDVVRFKYEKRELHKQGDAAFARGEYTAAYDDYIKAMRSGKKTDGNEVERRSWVRAELSAAALQCMVALGEYEAAGKLFVNLVRRDKDTVYFHLIPLAWTSASNVTESKVKAWIRASDTPAVQLLAASHLLRSPRRAHALAKLKSLAQDDDLRVAQLASAQLWLTRIPTATDDDLQRWREMIEKLPENLRGGPYYVLGRGYAARKQYQRAALALMRVPILFPHQGDLAAESLLAAGSSLASLRQTDEAVRVFREVMDDYPESFAAKEATERLERIGDSP